MNTPIADFVETYIKSNKARLHMPGHKGVQFLGIEQLDITEIKGADELYSPEGIILRSEENASALFSTKRTVYSAGGSSQSINAMLYLAKMRSQSRTVFASRNAHKSFLYACAKLDCNIHWLYPEENSHLCSGVISPEALKAELNKSEALPFAVYITSPDYLGRISNISGLSNVCKEFNIPLLVDNAHGAYLAFCKNNLHPIALGADMCCDSAHKTLPVLTGGGYLHIAKGDTFGFASHAVQAMEIFGSTSPSYLILQSLDLCNKYIDENIQKDLKICQSKIEEVRSAMPVPDVSQEPLKITADMRCVANRDIFEETGIEPEFSDGDFTVFMLTPQNSDEDFAKLKEAFVKMQVVKIICEEPPAIPRGVQKMSVRDAIFSLSETVCVENAVGRICAAPTVSCPPAIPIAVSGEEITSEHITLFKKYNINRISVVKK
ncbi:MAG: aminotransferase class V-fold PLP-dependent enzyme [Clostridia bacterium]|nr:aminotransferase class V-fold PLP-dependent enzyme [Clostridia bacterium]